MRRAQCCADSRPAARTAAPRSRYRQPLTSPAPPLQGWSRIGRRRRVRAASCRHRGRQLSPPAASKPPVDERGLCQAELVMGEKMQVQVGKVQ